MKNIRKQPNVSKLELLFQASKNGGAAAHFWKSPEPGSGLTFPNGPKSELPPPTPSRLASLRFAYPILSPGLRLAFLIFIYHNSYIDRPGSSMWILFPLLLENTEFSSLCRNTVVPHKKCRCHKRCFLVVGCSCRSERHCRRLVGHCCRCHLVLSGKSPKLPKKGRSCWEPVCWPKGKN